MTRDASRLFLACSLVVLPGLLARGHLVAQAPQQLPPVFRAEANLVEVIVRVTDEQGDSSRV